MRLIYEVRVAETTKISRSLAWTGEPRFGSGGRIGDRLTHRKAGMLEHLGREAPPVCSRTGPAAMQGAMWTRSAQLRARAVGGTAHHRRILGLQQFNEEARSRNHWSRIVRSGTYRATAGPQGAVTQHTGVQMHLSGTHHTQQSAEHCKGSVRSGACVRGCAKGFGGGTLARLRDGRGGAQFALRGGVRRACSSPHSSSGCSRKQASHKRL